MVKCNNIILNLLILIKVFLYYIILCYIVLHLTFFLILIYNLVKDSNGKIKLGTLDCSNKTIVRKNLKRYTDDRGGNNIQEDFFL